MSVLSLAASNLLSPVVLCYFLGIGARLLRSDLKVPESIYSFLTIYLLLSLGLKGGYELGRFPLDETIVPILMALVVALVTTLLSYGAARLLVRLGAVECSALAAHYGSVSVVTFITAVTFLQNQSVAIAPYATALVVLMEVPAIILALVVGRRALAREQRAMQQSAVGRAHEEDPGDGTPGSMLSVVREVLTSKSVVLLLGGLCIGILSSSESMAKVESFFFVPFQGVVALFLLEMGLLTASRLSDLRRSGLRLVAFGILVPLVNGSLGVAVGSWAAMGLGGATLLGVLAASASYIAAPAAVRLALPEASPSLYLSASLGISFPFNLMAGIPLYFGMARWWERVLW
jgi:hypothetical protein